MRSRPLLVLALGAAAGLVACGDAPVQDPKVVTGRVMSRTDERYCVSADRGATRTCVEVPDGATLEGVDVGQCVETATDLTRGGGVRVVPEAACAAGDLGE